jgi:peptidoglycan-N-acetylglucosamine deacetylase
MLYGLLTFIGMRAAWEDAAPLGRTLRQRWLAARATWLPRARRLATPMLVGLILLLQPAAATGVEVAVTFDDLPAHGPLPPWSTREGLVEDAIATLKRHRIVGAVGFVNGGQLVAGPEHGAILTRWIAAGYTLGNHTLSHSDLHRVDARRYLEDVDENERIVSRYGEAYAPKRFRYPYLHEGDTPDKRRTVRAALRARGYEITPVTVDFFDWTWNEAYTRCIHANDATAVEELKQSFIRRAVDALDWSQRSARTLVGRPIKHVLLLHVGAFDVLMLDDLLGKYEHHGVRFISVADAMTDAIYGMDADAAGPGQGNLLLQLLQARGRYRESARGVQPPAEVEAACR